MAMPLSMTLTVTVAGTLKGALICISRRRASARLVAEYIAGFFEWHHRLKFHDARLCFLQSVHP